MLFGIIFSIFAVINALVYLYVYAKELSLMKKKHLFKQAFQKGSNLGKDIETNINESATKSQKAGKIIGTILALIIFLFFAFIHVIIPLIVGFMVGLQEAIVSYFVIVIFIAIIGILRERNRPNYTINHKKNLLRALLIVFYFQVIIIVLFGFTPQLSIMIQQIYQSTFFLNNTFTFLMPTLFIGSLLMTLYFYWTGLRIDSKLNIAKKIHIRITTMLLIFVVSSFAGIIYLIEADFSFIDMSNGSTFDRIFNTFIFLLSSILIPLMFNLIIEAKKRREEVSNNSVVEQPKITEDDDSKKI
jgi:hypothetical protein